MTRLSVWMRFALSGLVAVLVACGDSSGDEGGAGSGFTPLAGMGAAGTGAAGTGDEGTSSTAGVMAGAAAAGTAAAGTGAAGTGAAPADADLMVTLDDGIVQGDPAGDSRRFLAIPFAKPPLGELRWKAPVPNDPWDGVRHETEFAPQCPQLMDQGAPASNVEDCLYLNVWAPRPAPTDAPVMVWIHGGGNFSGGAGIPVPTTAQLWYDGQHFAARQGVVLVSIQYRLGPFGFMAHPELAGEGEPLGNQGLHDQRRALEWVRDNIAKFGGDPNNVTIFGESAGSADVCYHVASPLSRGLFHRAIGQSGGCTIRTTGEESTAAGAADGMVAYGEAAGCPAGNGQLACLRDLPVQTLLDNGMQPSPGGGEVVEAQWRFAAVIDGEGGFLPDALRTLFDDGDIAQVPYLLGANNDEGTTFVWSAGALADEEAFLADMELRYPGASEDILAVYPVEEFNGSYTAMRARVIGDAGPGCSTDDTARRAAAAGLPVYMYNFNVAWGLSPQIFLAGHASEISHVFGAPYVAGGGATDPDDQAVADAMNTYWAQFARTGDPNYDGAPQTWPVFDPATDERLQLDQEWAILTEFRKEQCDFWRSYYGVE